MKEPVSITAAASVSPLGSGLSQAWQAYGDIDHRLLKKEVGSNSFWIAPLASGTLEEVNSVRCSDPNYSSLDQSVIFAMAAARNAIKQAGWSQGESFGINIGSSRGATTLFEKYHKEFLETTYAPTLASPTTTLGNISSWVSHDLQSSGPDISHSITCSTALHALLNGVAWLGSGLSEKFVVGGSEAPLTPFTLAQMQALKIYAQEDSGRYPCKALDLSKKQNSMVLGEGASILCLEKGRTDNALALVSGVGYATEPLTHSVSLSSDARCFQRSMKMALGNHSPDSVDVVVMHAPGTIRGDQSEYAAIGQVFGSHLPALTTNKWKIGHTFGPSGTLSIELAILMMRHQKFIGVPFVEEGITPGKLGRIMVNAVGFGGNAVSIMLEATNTGA